MWGALIAGVMKGAASKYVGEKASETLFDKGKSGSEKASAIGAGLGEKAASGAFGGVSASSSSSNSMMEPMKLSNPKPGRLGFDNNFYGHYLPSHFKKTSIISTNGRVR